jgi:lipopolysaccharide transport system permease protein
MPSHSQTTAVRTATIIAPPQGWVSVRLPELWTYRELLYCLVWREIKVRYKQTAIGVSWAIVQPFFTMVVFSVFFGRFAGIPSDGVPYPVFAYCALLPWQLFAFALAESTNSVVNNQRLLTKVYFPRVILPLSAIGVGLVDFVLAFAVLFGLMAYFGVGLVSAIWTVPLWAALAVLTALSAGLWLSALNVAYRDIRYAVPFLTQIWLFATPVAYPTSIVPEAWRPIYALNPMVGVVDGFRWALLGTTPPAALTVAVSAASVLLLLTSGLYYFRRTERTFADII